MDVNNQKEIEVHLSCYDDFMLEEKLSRGLAAKDNSSRRHYTGLYNGSVSVSRPGFSLNVLCFNILRKRSIDDVKAEQEMILKSIISECESAINNLR